MSFDLYQSITDRIIAALEQGVIPWEKPWVSAGVCISHITGKHYSLLNQLLLAKPGEYVTFKQAAEEGGHVRKGEKSSMVVFWKWLDKKDEDGSVVIGPDGKPEQVPFLRYYNVFHLDQCEGLMPKHTQIMPDVVQPVAAAEQIITDYCTRCGVKLNHEEGDHAYYSPSTDSITLPTMKQFVSAAEYYSTAFHETVHSTGHPRRLDRLNLNDHFGGLDYSKEELVAEIGAATLVHHVGLETDGSFRNNTAYIKHWLSVLKDDKRLVVSAAGKAEKAVKLILNSDAANDEDE